MKINFPWRPRPTATPSGLTCCQMVELMTAYLDGALSDGERARFEAHVAACDPCHTYLEQMRMTIRVTGEMPPLTLPPEVERHLLEAFRGWKAAEA
jgi:anti-sigma factor RsiW